MKTKYLYAIAMSLVLAFGFTGCSNDDDPVNPIPEAKEKSKLTFDTDTLKVSVGESATFNITAGGGDYKVISENPKIAQGTVNGSVVTITCSDKGLTGIIISDADGNYKRLTVKSMYTVLALNKENVSVGMKLGHDDGKDKVIVKKGNGGYTASSANENIAKVSRIENDSVIVIQGVAAGSTTVTVTDMMSLSKTVNVTVETTTIPYTEEEKKEITNSREYRLCWDGTTKSETQVNTMENGQHKMGWDYGWGSYKYYWAYVYFTGDLTVGKKTNGRISAKLGYSEPENEYEDVEVEIIKNDGLYVWGIMSVIKNNYLHYGYFCQPIP